MDTVEMRELVKRFCSAPTAADIPLKLRTGLAPLILKDKRFSEASTELLIERARKKLKSTPADRATAIAVLQGV